MTLLVALVLYFGCMALACVLCGFNELERDEDERASNVIPFAAHRPVWAAPPAQRDRLAENVRILNEWDRSAS